MFHFLSGKMYLLQLISLYFFVWILSCLLFRGNALEFCHTGDLNAEIFCSLFSLIVNSCSFWKKTTNYVCLRKLLSVEKLLIIHKIHILGGSHIWTVCKDDYVWQPLKFIKILNS